MNRIAKGSPAAFDATEVFPCPDPVSIFRVMAVSREAETRESILFRQGRGQFHLPSAGHEALAGLSSLIGPRDYTYCYYRDRALLLGMGVPLYDIALGYFAKAESSSGGRQMASHFSFPEKRIMSCATPTGLQCLPAAGTAAALKRDGKGGIALCCIGDAAARQGEFFEAVAMALQDRLPVVFLIEDNGFGVSTRTDHMNPVSLGFFNPEIVRDFDGRNPLALRNDMRPVLGAIRAGEGPAVVRIRFDRLMSHTSSDDHTRYRSAGEIREMERRDPLVTYGRHLVESDLIDAREEAAIREAAQHFVRETYRRAEAAPAPDPQGAMTNIFARQEKRPAAPVPPAPEGTEEWTMGRAFNTALGAILESNPGALVFGEDVEDPKGGVFGLTKGLSTRYSGRVTNSPLAEATIAGMASGYGVAGCLPIFELQFIDFIGPAFNQIVNQIATLRWRTAGRSACPLVIYAPCGSFISGGGPWHSQTNESWLAHAPGLKVYMPSTADDAASMLLHAAAGADPVMLLLPKNLLQKSMPREPAASLHPERARVRVSGGHVTIAAWGNCVSLALRAAGSLAEAGVEAEVIDLPSIVPCDWQTLRASVRKTGRLVVVQEDNRTCSFGQAIISELTGDPKTWESLYAAPQLVTREDVHVGFSAVLETAVLPNHEKIIRAVEQTLGEKL